MTEWVFKNNRGNEVIVEAPTEEDARTAAMTKLWGTIPTDWGKQWKGIGLDLMEQRS